MKSLGNELRKFLYLPWIPAALALTLAFLVFFFYKLNPGQADAKTALLFLVSERKFHPILYALAALFVLGLDVDSRAVDAELMAGRSSLGIGLRKAILYFAMVLVLNVIYSAVCLSLAAAGDTQQWRVLLVRLLIDLGAAAVFLPLQAVFRSLQPTLILSGVAAAVFIVADSPAYELWYAVINGGGLPVGKIVISVVAVILCTAATAALLRGNRNGNISAYEQ